MIQYYVYLLIDSTTGQPFYVGKGSGGRMYQHLNEAQREGYIKRSVHCKIVSILNKGGTITYKKIVCDSEQHAFSEEKRLIDLHGRKDNGTGILCNLTDGGEGKNRSRDSIERTASKHRGQKRSEASRDRMRKAQLKIADHNRALYGTGVKPTTITKMSQSRRGKPWSDRARAVARIKPTAKVVQAYYKNTGEFVGEWESISSCATALGCDTTAVWRICEGTPCSRSASGILYPMKSSKGYVFKYK